MLINSYVLYLLLVTYKSPRTLMRDTGPEQFFFVPDGEGAILCTHFLNDTMKRRLL